MVLLLQPHQIMRLHQVHQTPQQLSKVVLHKVKIMEVVQVEMAPTLLMLHLERIRREQQPVPKTEVGTYQPLRLPNQLLRIQTQMLTEQLDIM